MRPIRLKIKGINSFTDEQTVDFEKLSKDGLFGIVGDTGSGKSSILDAMTIALYGDLSKNTNEFINKETNTASVAFDFAVDSAEGESIYRAERTFRRTKTKECDPGITRLYKRGETDEVIADRIKDMNRAVENIIGLSYGDFTRTVVLPQGKFSEFLNLKGAERRSMLERIFGLEKYGSALASRLKGERAETAAALNTVCSKIEVYGDVSRELCGVKEKELKILLASLKKRTAETEEIRKRAAEAERIAETVAKMKKCGEEIKSIETEREGIDLFAQKIGLDRADEEKLNEKAVSYRQAINLNAEIRDNAAERDKLIKKENTVKEKQSALKAERQKLDKTSAELSEKIKAAEALREQLSAERSRDMAELIEGEDRLKELREKVYNAKDAFDRQKKLYTEINALIAEIKEEKEKAEGLEKAVLSAEKEKTDIEQALETAKTTLELLKEKNMAAVLANRLKDGEACPVCGSMEHPAAAQSIENAVIEACDKEIKELETRKNKADKELTRLKAEYAASTRLLESKSDQKTEKEKESGGVTLAELKEAYSKAAKEYKAEEKLDNERKKAREKEKKYQEAEKAEKALRKQAEDISVKMSQTDKQLADCVTEEKLLTAEINRLDSESRTKRAEAEKITGGENPEKLLKDTQNAVDIMKNYSRRRNLVEDTLKELTAELGERTLADGELEEIRSRLKQAEKDREEMSKEAAVRDRELKRMKADTEAAEQLKAEEKKLRKRNDMLNELSKLTEGNRFVEYMAENRLKYIASDASVRLKGISGGRYALELLDGEFIIRDDFSGGIRRRPATLSGGETFLTSFALALSLSDRIQMKNSSPLKFFFLDEGFGTLDKSTLDVVMHSLENLTSGGMTVGLITHVEEVKERLPAKLVVEAAVPGERGSRVSIV
ncbi:MAG: SMC family ATPase [Clostridia bacterium]|nr:SMC family ATPase [Clostridia bacterium]